ncbi:DMT family transporter [Paenibacillus popilliae]|uniref:DMT family transporter n=1 Tax=Paenibacillus popilliae TaxID=78057 RepID=UPI0021AFBF63|nr:SMR family transporter [Paenibacillus sp. SDF0028]
MNESPPLKPADEEAAAVKKSKAISVNRAWLYIVVGGTLEIVWASGFKYEQIPPLVVLVALLLSFDLIIRAAAVIPIGTTYAVFAGIGTVGTVVVEAVMSNTFNPLKIGIILLLLLFIMGLKLTSGKEGH